MPDALPMAPAIQGERRLFFDLSARTKLRVAGADVFRFLNGQITNDLRKATAASAIQASLLTAKGKLSAHVFISRESDAAFVLDAERGLGEELAARLERYVIADDVQIEDVTERFSLFHFASESPRSWQDGGRLVASQRFGIPGWDFWADAKSLSEQRSRSAGDYEFCDDDCAEVLRIERGIAAWGRELTGEIIPVEANLEESSIDYGKGCYIGQEVISRMKMSGQTNKRLCGLVSLNGAPLKQGMVLTSASDAGRECGWITSATRSERLGKQIGLGYVKRGFNEVNTELLAAEVPVRVAALPFI